MQQDISSEFPFESKFLTVKGSKIHYIDEGEGDPVLFLHGNPTSSYLWRNIVPHLSGQARCIAPDLIGMGKSDQPDLDYGFADSYAYLKAFIEALELDKITLVLHDWGSGLGFHYAYQHPDKVKGIAFMEAVYRLVDFEKLPRRIRGAMKLMRRSWANYLLLGYANMFIRKMLPNGILRKLSPAEKAVYAEPYPTIQSRKPLRVWPTEIPIHGSPEHTHEIVSAYQDWLLETEIPKLLLYADPGLLINIAEVPWIEENMPNLKAVHVGEGLHFIQEDQPEAIGTELAKWYATI